MEEENKLLEEFEAMEMAIVSEVHFGMRDTRNDKPCLWFSINFKSGSSLQILQGEEIEKMLMESEVYDIKDLKNKPCYVIRKGSTVKFVRMAPELLSK